MSVPLSPEAASLLLDDPAALAQFGKLEVVARLVVEGYLLGRHKSPFKGASVEFVEHRQYYPGDEIRHIDWRAFGKTDRYYVKEFEDETNLCCHLIVDVSGSMSYAGRGPAKFEYARLLAAALSYLLLTQRDAVGLTTFDSHVRDRVAPSSRAQNLHHILDVLGRMTPGGETSLAGVVEAILPTIRRRGLVVVLSDCFDQPEPLFAALGRLRRAHHEVVLFQILDPDEEEFPFHGPTRFLPLEGTAGPRNVAPRRLRARYLARFRAFCRELEQRCGRLNVDYRRFLTTRPYHEALGAYLAARARVDRKR